MIPRRTWPPCLPTRLCTAASAGPRGRIWPHDIGSNRLYATVLLGHFRGTHRTTRCCSNARFEEHLSLSDQGIERPAADPRRICRRKKPFPHRSHLCAGAPRRSVRYRPSAMGQERPVRDADAGRGPGPGPNLARCRDPATDDYAGQSPALVADLNDEDARGRVEEIFWQLVAGLAQSRRRWCARATGISWTSPTMSFR